MNNENVMYGIIRLLLGRVIAGFTTGQAVNNNNTGMMLMTGMDTSNLQELVTSHGTMSIADMSKQLEGLSGDDYDKAFIEMIEMMHQ